MILNLKNFEILKGDKGGKMRIGRLFWAGVAFFVLLAGMPMAAGAIPAVEREALIALYNSTGGDNWFDNTGWLGAEGTECDWYGVSCGMDQVVGIDMGRYWNDGNNLVGLIPKEIGNLVNLRSLYLAYNQLTSLPSEIGNLVNLTLLYLHYNQLTSLPPEIGNLINLNGLDVSSNQLTKIPSEIGNLSNLTWLDVSDNQLTNLPFEIGNLINLIHLKVAYNQLSSLPSEIGNLVNLVVLNVYGNQLRSLPSEIANLINLKKFDAGYNQLTSLPSELWTLVNLMGLSVCYNQLTSLPSEIGNLINLESGIYVNDYVGLNLSNNKLTFLPIEIKNLTKLQGIDISNNLIEGSFSDGISSLTNLVNGKSDFCNNHLHTDNTELRDFLNQKQQGGDWEICQRAEPYDSQKQRESLIALYNSTDGDNWIDNTGWLGPEGTECDWYGVSCEGNRVVGIDMGDGSLNEGNNLVGSVPSEIGNLVHLNWLHIANNELTSLPYTIGNLVNLTKLDVFNNLFMRLPSKLWTLANLTELNIGSNGLSNLPHEVGNLSNLTKLDISGNFLRRLPSELWTLVKLIELDVGINQLTSLPLEIGNLENLTVLSVHWNQLASLPPEIGSIANLTMLEVGENQLTSLPFEIGNLTNLTALYAYGNQLTSLSSEIGNLVNLTMLEVGDNKLTSFPPDVGNLENLTVLYVYWNQLTSLPPEIGNLSNLKELYVFANGLKKIPSEIGNLTNLTVLDVRGNQLTSLFPEIGNLENLFELYVNNNQLVSLPHEIGNLVNLAVLDVGDNQLTSLPPEIGNLVNLTSSPFYSNYKGLNLKNNQLTSLPIEISNLTKLQGIDISNNLIEGPIPEELINLTSLVDGESDFCNNYLYTDNADLRDFLNQKQRGGDWESCQRATQNDLAIQRQALLALYDSTDGDNWIDNAGWYGVEGTECDWFGISCDENGFVVNIDMKTSSEEGNNLSGPIPSEIGDLTNIVSLDLRWNNITALPPELGELVNLNFLNLWENQLTSLPQEIGDLGNLSTLILGNNQLGTLPSGIGNLTNLNHLDLWGNQLTTLPPEFANLVNLNFLTLGNNQFAALPSALWQLLNLVSLDLWGNQLTELPSEIGELSNLESLVLGKNQLAELPPEIWNLTNLLSLNLWDNQLANLSPNIGNLNNLASLNLSLNQLTELPSEIWSLENLASLAINNNQLSSLPMEIGNLVKLQQVDVSNNQIQGPIPEELMNLINLVDGESDFCNNYLHTDNTELRDFLNQKQNGGDWESCQRSNNIQRQALIALYNSTDGENWIDNTGWLGEEGTECDWFGVSCEGDVVVGIDMGKDWGEGNNLVGPIPGEIGYLRNLTSLFLASNGIESLPDGIGYLTNLTVLDVSYNQLSSLPSEIGNLVNLTSLDVGGNQLINLPSEVGYLINLTELYIWYNKLTSLPVEIGNLSNLNWLYATDNILTSLPSEIAKLSKLIGLYAGENQLTKLPTEIGGLANLVEFFVNNNELTSLPAEIGYLANMGTLGVSGNQLTSLPDEIGNLFNLTWLYVEDNLLTSIPIEIGNLVKLTRFYISNNKLTSLPKEIQNLTALSWFLLSNNELINLPAEIGRLSSLTQLYVQENALTSLPPEIGNLANLSALNLYSNELTSLPSEIGNLANLIWIDVGDNKLTSLPPEFGNLINLTSNPIPNNYKGLNLSNNQLTSLPIEIGNLTKLQGIDISNNLIEGPVPEGLANLTSLVDGESDFCNNYLYTDNADLRDFLNQKQRGGKWESCQRTGPYDPQKQREALIALYNSTGGDNWIDNTGWLGTEGTECDWFGVGCDDWGRVVGIILGNPSGGNNLVGSIPPEIGGLVNLELLFLTNNQLTNLPPEIGNLIRLQGIDISKNLIEGPAPEELLNLTNLLDGGSNFCSNYLYTVNSTLRDFLNQKQTGGDWESCQLQKQREALIALYNSTGGDNWIDNTGWLGSKGTECEWFGVSCEGDVIVSIDMRHDNDAGNNLVGPIPPEIQNLDHLKHLNLESNQITELPPEIGNLVNLTLDLDLNDNLLTTLPAEIGNLVNLTKFDLDNNQLTTLPSEIGNLTSLVDLEIVGNQLTALPAEIGNLASLADFDLNDNQLTELPPEFWNLTNLTILHLEDNQLTTLPPEIGNLNKLQTINISNNLIEGSVPEEIMNLTSLVDGESDFCNNYLHTDNSELRDFLNQKQSSGDWEICQRSAQFDPQKQREALIALYNSTDGENWIDNTGWLGEEGTECDWFGVSCEGNVVTRIEMRKITSSGLHQGNNLVGVIPPEIGYLTKLIVLNLEKNHLTSMPKEIGNLINLEILDLWDNQIQTVPSEIGELASLNNLDLDGNGLTNLPSEIGNLSNLSNLDIRNNQLKSLPLEIWHLENLEELHLTGNQFAILPPDIENLVNLTELSLQFNQLTALPMELWGLQNLTSLYLSFNQLKDLPANIGDLTHLVNLDLAGNQFAALPQEIGNLVNLEFFDIGNNQLTSLPSELWNLVNLTFLSVRDNQLSDISSDIVNLSKIHSLDLGGNRLTTLPSELWRLDNLSFLSIRDNQLNSLPSDIGNLTNIDSLYIGGNNLEALPETIWDNVNLSTLSARNNQLDSISSNINKLTRLAYLDLGDNQLSELPNEFWNLPNLMFLSLRDNQFSAIPPDIQNFVKLTYLDLGGNQLTTLPTEFWDIANLTFLGLKNNEFNLMPANLGHLVNLDVLDLSGNQLSTLPGEIDGNQALSYLLLSNNYIDELPVEFWKQDQLLYLDLSRNQLTELPSDIGNLKHLGNKDVITDVFDILVYLSYSPYLLHTPFFSSYSYFSYIFDGYSASIEDDLFEAELNLSYNQLATIPPEIGNLTNLQGIDVSNNLIEGPAPEELLNLTNLADDKSDFCNNYLYTDNTELQDFLNQKQKGGDWESCQRSKPIGNHAPAIFIDRIGVANFNIPQNNITGDGGLLMFEARIIDHDGVADDGSSHEVAVIYPDGQTYPMQFSTKDGPDTATFNLGDNSSLVPAIEGNVYTFEVTDPDGLTARATDVLEGTPLAPPDKNSFKVEVNGTTVFFSWDQVANAKTYMVGVFDANMENVWWEETGKAAITLPPGVLTPETEYAFSIYAMDSHIGFENDNMSSNINLNAISSDPFQKFRNQELTFDTDATSAAPFIDIKNGVTTQTDAIIGTHVEHFIHVYDAQGVPDGIASVKAIRPDGTEMPLYYDQGHADNTAYRGVYRNSQFDSPEAGDYTFIVEDTEGNSASATDHFAPAPLPVPALIQPDPAANTALETTQADFDWEDIPGAVFYTLTILDKQLALIESFNVTDSHFQLPAGVLKPEQLYRVNIQAWDMFYEKQPDNCSELVAYQILAPTPTFVTSKGKSGGASVPVIDLENWGAYVSRTNRPGQNAPFYSLNFYISVEDADGVPENIQSVQVQTPSFSGNPEAGTRYELRFDHVPGNAGTHYYFALHFDRVEDIPSGAYTFTATDFDGNIAQAIDDLTINELAVPENLSPQNGGTLSLTNPLVSWADVPGAATYRVKIYDGWDGATYSSGHLAESYFLPPEGTLSPDHIYSYRVVAHREDGTQSDVDNMSISHIYPGNRVHFTTRSSDNLPPATPQLITPTNESILPPTAPLFQTTIFSDPDGDAHSNTHWTIRRFDRPFYPTEAPFNIVSTEDYLTEYAPDSLPAGLKYVAKAAHGDGAEWAWSDEVAFKVGVSVSDSVQAPAGTTQPEYRMISFVQWPDDPRLTAVMGDDIGEVYDTTLHRIGTYNPLLDAYEEYHSGMSVEPGRAFWILARNGVTIDMDGVPVSLDHDIEVPLAHNPDAANGWNMIAPPNNRVYAWDAVEIMAYDENGQPEDGPTALAQLPEDNPFIDKRLWRWENGDYFSDTETLSPYKGYWVRVLRENVSLRFPADAEMMVAAPPCRFAQLAQKTGQWLTGRLPEPRAAQAAPVNRPPEPIGGLTPTSGSSPASADPTSSTNNASTDSGESDNGGGGGGCFIRATTQRP